MMSNRSLHPILRLLQHGTGNVAAKMFCPTYSLAARPIYIALATERTRRRQSWSSRGVPAFGLCRRNSSTLPGPTHGADKFTATAVTVTANGRKINLSWKDGHESSCHVLWLRHNCECPDCLSSSGQKVISIEHDMATGRSRGITSANLGEKGLEVEFSGNGRQHRGYISLQLLREYCNSPSAIEQRRQESRPPFATFLPKVDGKDVMESEETLWQWLHYLNEYGLCLLTNIPARRDELLQVGRRIGNIQWTIYGRESDVALTDMPTNVAYTTRGLPFHMDLSYYESPPGLQFQHCLKFDSCVKGGESLLVDAYAVAEKFREKHPEHFATMVRVPTTLKKIHYERETPVCMTYQRPTFTTDNTTGMITGINWSPSFEGPLCVPEEDVEPYYEAYFCLNDMLVNSEYKLEYNLQPGELLTFNNRRVLHGRTTIDPCGGTRLLQICYINIDEFKSRYRVLTSLLGKDVPCRHVFNQDLL